MSTAWTNAITAESPSPFLWVKFDEATTGTTPSSLTNSGTKTFNDTNGARGGGSTGATIIDPAKSNKGMSFVGDSASGRTYYTWASTSNFNLEFDDGKWSVEWWAKTPYLFGGKNPTAWSVAGLSGRFIQATYAGVGQTNAGRLYVQCNGSSGNISVISSTTTPTTDVWQHYVVTYDSALGSNNLKLYINGSLDAQVTGTFGTVESPAFRIGTSSGISNTFMYQGSIDEVIIWEQTLTATDVLDHYNSLAAVNININETPATASALMTNETVTAVKNVNNSETPATASALFVDPTVFLGQNANIAADPMVVTNAELIDPTVSVIRNIDIIETPMTVTLATMPDSTQIAEQTVSVAWLPATVNAEFVDPTVTGTANISADPMIVSNAVFVNPDVSWTENWEALMENYNPIIRFKFDESSGAAINYGSLALTNPTSSGTIIRDIASKLDESSRSEQMNAHYGYRATFPAGTFSDESFTAIMIAKWTPPVGMVNGDRINIFSLTRVSPTTRTGPEFGFIMNTGQYKFAAGVNGISTVLSHPDYSTHGPYYLWVFKIDNGYVKIWQNNFLSNEGSVIAQGSDSTIDGGLRKLYVLGGEHELYGESGEKYLEVDDFALFDYALTDDQIRQFQWAYPLGDTLLVPTALMVDPVITAIKNVNNLETPATASALFVNPAIAATVNVMPDPATASAEFVNPTILAVQNNNIAADPSTASALFVDPTVSLGTTFTSDVLTASAEFVDPTTFIEDSVPADPATASAEFVYPAILVEETNAADPMTASAEFVQPILSVNEELIVNALTASAEFVDPALSVEEVLLADPATASAEIVNATVSVEESNPADIMIASTDIVEPVITTTSNVDFAADFMFVSLATMPDSVIFTQRNVSLAWLPDVVNAEFVDPSILAQQNLTISVAPMTASALSVNPVITTTSNINISASPLIVSNAVFVNPDISINEIIVVQIGATANARLTVNHTGTSAWDGWDDDLTNFNRNADGWHGHVPFGFLVDNLPGQITPSLLATSWSTSGWTGPYSALNGQRVFRNTTSTFGPDDDGIYAIGGINNLEDAYFRSNSAPSINNASIALSTERSVISYRSSTTVTLPSCIGHKNIGASSYTSSANLVKQFSYEFLFKTTDTNAVLAGGGMVDRTNLNAYWSEFRIENGYPVFEYIVTDNSGVKLNEFKFTGSTVVNTGQWTHLVIQTNKNDGKYQNLQGLIATADKTWVDPVSLNNEVYDSIDIYVNGRLSSKDKFDFTDMSDDTNNVSIGNIITVGRRFTRFTTAQDGSGTTFYYATDSGTANRFTGTWAGMVQRTTDVYNTQFVGTTSQTLVNGYVALNPADIEIMANLALRNRMRFADANDGATAEMISPTISTNTKKLLRLYFFGDNATNEMFGVNSNLHNVVTYSAINNVSTDNDKLLNADKAYLGGASDPETDSAEIIVDAWRDDQGYKRFINLQSDIEEYSDIDGIIFADYPDDGVEWSQLMPGYSDQWVSDKYDEFISSIRQAVNSGKGLYVSSSRLAADLKIISDVQEISQEIESSITISDPFGDSLGDVFYDTNRNNKYKIVAQEQDLTTVPSFIMTDFISHSGELTDDYHVKYANRPNGLQIGDKLIIPSLPLMKAQMLTDLAGDTSNRLGENTLEVFKYSDILAGRAVAELADTGYVTTIILEPGDVLDGEVIGGKIIVNCVEDGLATGLDEYNYGYRQVVSVNDSAENATTIQWDYSTSRTTRQLEPLVISPDTKGQTFPTQGGGGPVIQSATHSSAANIRTKFDQANETFTSGIYFDVNSEKYDLDRIPVYSMTYRGINWLLQPSDRQGTFVGEESAKAEATFVQPTTNTQIIVPLPPKNASINAAPATAQATLVTNISALYGNANTIILTLHHQDVITLYIEKERL